MLYPTLNFDNTPNLTIVVRQEDGGGYYASDLCDMLNAARARIAELEATRAAMPVVAPGFGGIVGAAIGGPAAQQLAGALSGAVAPETMRNAAGCAVVAGCECDGDNPHRHTYHRKSCAWACNDAPETKTSDITYVKLGDTWEGGAGLVGSVTKVNFAAGEVTVKVSSPVVAPILARAAA